MEETGGTKQGEKRNPQEDALQCVWKGGKADAWKINV